MDLEFLRKVGLSEGEIKVYSAILDIGKSSINIIHERVGIDRRNIYDILNKLIERGIITYTEENNKRAYQAANPRRIISYIEEKRENLNKIKAEAIKYIPLLVQKFVDKRPEIGAEVFRSKEGIKAIWEDTLSYKEVYWLGSGRYVPKQFPNFFVHWNERRIKKKVKWFNLMREDLRKEVTNTMPYEHIKFLPQEFSGSPTVICIYGSKVVNFIFGESLFAFLIESKDLAENYKRYHKYLWDNVAKS